ncbi:MAG: hypothetical protein LUD79_00985 [Oscillospiraceae bacterium]|nr:hypothetical protein [Oscillospiraceae bacterium]
MMKTNLWKRNALRGLALITAAAIVCLGLAGCQSGSAGDCTASSQQTASTGDSASSGGQALAEAVYPEELAYPGEDDYDAWEEWYDQIRAKWDAETDAAGLVDFFSDSSRVFLSGAEGENLVYSPLNTCLALGMLAETTAGESQTQILDALGAEDITTLRAQVQSLWEQNYSDDGMVTSVFANSLWLRDNLTYRQDTLDTLAACYYASSFSGMMGSSGYDRQLQDWVNQQTGNLLEESVSGLSLKEDTVMAILSTSLFRATWTDSFSEQNNTQGTFHGSNGDEEVTFLNRSHSGTYLTGEGFTAAVLSLNYSGGMWLILPDEGVSVDEVLAGDGLNQILTYLNAGEEELSWEDVGLSAETRLISFSVPKFDVSSEMDMLDGLVELGITDVMIPGAADFSTLLDMSQLEDGAFLSTAVQAARVSIDEEGVTGAAYVELATTEGAEDVPPEQVDFVLDRPFLFVVTGVSGAPLYVGVVNQMG